MIDTIILRIHDTNKYSHLIKGLDNLDEKGYSTQTAKVKGSDIRNLRRQGIKKGKDIIEVLQIHRKGEFLIKTKVAKQMNASNHYAFAYFVNYVADYIEFNFSIPKYLYGSNVLMFVEHIFDPGYTLANCGELEYNMQKSFELLQNFLNQFFKMEFLNVDINYRDVEVHRIDVCFNQIFRSKDDALKYLEYQKLKRKKYSRNDEDGVMRDYATSLMYVTKRYSAKIYHKGAEYEKNDLKEHLKINREKERRYEKNGLKEHWRISKVKEQRYLNDLKVRLKEMGRRYFKTEEYQELADRTLRYELTIRNSLLNYLHKEKIFRAKCSNYQDLRKVYDEVENIHQKNDRISKVIGKLPIEERDSYSKLHPYQKIDSDSRKIHKYVSRLITKRTKFMLDISEEAKIYNRMTTAITNCDYAYFSKKLLNLCFDKLLVFMDEFQIKELPPINRIEKLIDLYNIDHRKKLPKSEMLGFYKDLCNVGSFNKVGKMNYMSRASIFRYKERFRKIGITENNLIPLTEDGIPNAPLDLRAYHHEMTTKIHFLQKKTFPIII